MDLNEYLKEFEQKVVVAGFKAGEFPKKEFVVPLRSGKFKDSPLEEFMGKQFECDCLLGINYYGFYKVSSEVGRAVDSVANIFQGIRSIKAPVVFFKLYQGRAYR
jgi:hypothetical protein